MKKASFPCALAPTAVWRFELVDNIFFPPPVTGVKEKISTILRRCPTAVWEEKDEQSDVFQE
ncbi:MAG: hypothetical protein LBR79_04610 [Oscillospiraceae bacterium]|nr:hypothetical protein [Oscillospiraceae bacterium]